MRIGINGFGRVGRCALRSAVESGAPIEWAGINDVADVAALAHLWLHPVDTEAGLGPYGCVRTPQPWFRTIRPPHWPAPSRVRYRCERRGPRRTTLGSRAGPR